MMAVNVTGEEKALTLEGLDPARLSCQVTDEHRRMEEAALVRGGALHLPARSLSYLAW